MASQNRQRLKRRSGSPLPLGVWPLRLPLPPLRETFCVWFTPICPPHPPEAKPPPSYHLGSGRRPEKLHCTELSNTLYISILWQLLTAFLRLPHLMRHILLQPIIWLLLLSTAFPRLPLLLSTYSFFLSYNCDSCRKHLSSC
jgi:hypothetical protein